MTDSQGQPPQSHPQAYPQSVTGERHLQAAPAGPARRTGLARLWKDWLEPIVFALLITQFIVTMVAVDGVSMMPNLRDGERVIVPKYEGWLHRAGIGEFGRGDIVVFKPPQAASEVVPTLRRDVAGLWTYRPYLIKRIIGVEGDRIRIQGGDVWINDKPLDSSFTTAYWQEQGCWDRDSAIANQATSAQQGMMPDQLELTVPEGHYFVMGDNRTANGSEDSRAFGTVPLSDIAGRAAFVVWPIQRPTELAYDCQNSRAGQASPEKESALRSLPAPAGFGELSRQLGE
ncbi:signal peptidase I [Deinococcus proteolyticus MRP]|uniref:Signal peptidase I n=1 Tax=Deinococcus proteolyticus (strain ATCC 35074 / DSM 20540 / JCM 6276 / NBRC 101906 / NCIMB 13154 / VKM Ac-1939 / CCM 2703 / MRP) TaxID=693977 RepID=F0RM80_DEIPM|nr:MULTISPECIES: signal peptidase I [Deinococcus]ADY26000.1 signal peptidase I [Deinococcus proteolyticus MRP]MCY1702121.1 signal peptidase I [Deinococcus sp. SL84]